MLELIYGLSYSGPLFVSVVFSLPLLVSSSRDASLLDWQRGVVLWRLGLRPDFSQDVREWCGAWNIKTILCFATFHFPVDGFRTQCFTCGIISHA